jgi:hypothetical protein
MRSVRLSFVTACAVYAIQLAIGTHMRSTVYAYKAQTIWRFFCRTWHTPTICYRMRTIQYAYYLLPYAHFHSVGLLFADLCAVYANEANKTLILPFQQNQVKTY